MSGTIMSSKRSVYALVLKFLWRVVLGFELILQIVSRERAIAG
jgi:hypothetical protein